MRHAQPQVEVQTNADRHAGLDSQRRGPARQDAQEESREDGPVEQAADFVDGFDHGIADRGDDEGKGHREHAPENGEQFGHQQVVALAGVGPKVGLVEVAHAGRAHGVERRVQARHGRRQHRDKQEADQAVGEVVHDEQRHHPVGMLGGDQRPELRRQQSEAADHQPHRAVEQHNRKPRQRVQQQRALDRVNRAHRQLALHLALVAAVVGDVEEEAAQQHGPEGVVLPAAVAPLEIQHAEALRLAGIDVQHRLQPADLLVGHRRQHEDADPQDAHLDHVAPDHRANASQRVVENSDNADADDVGPHAPRVGLAEEDGHHEADRVHGHARRQPPADLEQQADEDARAAVEALLQVLVDADHARAVIDRQQKDHDEHQRQRHPELVGQPAQSAARRHVLQRHKRRCRNKADGAQLRRHGRNAARPPAHRAPAHVVVFLAGLAAVEVHPHRQQKNYVAPHQHKVE